MAAVQNPDKLIWQSYNDSGLMVLVCLKLEAILTELLARFCLEQESDTGKAVLGHYKKKYRSRCTANYTTIEDGGNYRDILKDHFKMTLGSLIFEVFVDSTPRESSYPNDAGYPAKTLQFSTDDKEKFNKINELRSRVIHYGRGTHEGILGYLVQPDDIREVMCQYDYIINKSEVFKLAYPNSEEDQNVRKEFMELKKIYRFELGTGRIMENGLPKLAFNNNSHPQQNMEKQSQAPTGNPKSCESKKRGASSNVPESEQVEEQQRQSSQGINDAQQKAGKKPKR